MRLPEVQWGWVFTEINDRHREIIYMRNRTAPMIVEVEDAKEKLTCVRQPCDRAHPKASSTDARRRESPASFLCGRGHSRRPRAAI